MWGGGVKCKALGCVQSCYQVKRRLLYTQNVMLSLMVTTKKKLVNAQKKTRKESKANTKESQQTIREQRKKRRKEQRRTTKTSIKQLKWQ